MISKNKIKAYPFVLRQKKEERSRIICSRKDLKLSMICCTKGLLQMRFLEDIEDIKKVSFLQHPQPVLGIFRMPEEDCKVTIDYLSLFNRYIDNQLVLALDGVQDPGNLGTIIRIADWFGIENIFCTNETADCWNPKVVQATMGSIARVKLHYLNLNELIRPSPC